MKKRTHYFKKPWTWIKTGAIISVIVLFIVLWETVDNGSEYAWVRFVIGTILIFGIPSAPVDDLALDDTYFYHFKTSLLPALSKVNKYKIAEINIIRLGGVHSQTMEALEFLTGNAGSTKNTIELTLKDVSYRSIDLMIYRKELNEIISMLKEMMNQNVIGNNV